MGLINKLFGKAHTEEYALKRGGYSLSAYFGILCIRVPRWAKHWSVDPYGGLVVWENSPEYDNFAMDFEADGKCLPILRLDKDNIITTAKGELYDV